MGIYKNDDGTYPAYAWPGGYTIIYIMDDGGIICPSCANGQNGSEASESSEWHGWKIVGQDTYDEGDDIPCDHCGKMIESSYGPIETD